METSVAVLVGFALGVAAVLIGQRLLSRQFLSGLPPATGTAGVTISLDPISGEPTAWPDPVPLANGREVSWKIDPLMEAGVVVIDFAYQGSYKGPFVDKLNNPHRDQQVGRGKYRRKKGDKRPIDSNDAEYTGLWKYSVTYTPDGGQPKTKDPAVCIRN
jgi:hypothetical protein